MSKKKIYFLSDIHLGLYSYESSLRREKLMVELLDEIKDDVEELFLLGDIFDFWYEYKNAAPRGFVRFLGKIAEIADSGVPVHYFTGNHDIWVFDYLPKELGVKLYRKPIFRDVKGKKFYIAHGDGLGPTDYGFKMLKAIFTNKILQWCFSRLHPNFAIGIAKLWSNKNREFDDNHPDPFTGEEKERLVVHSKDILKKQHVDFFVYGHRHLPIHIHIGENSQMVYNGDWINNFTYTVFDGDKIEIKRYKESK